MRLSVAALLLLSLSACSGFQIRTSQDWETDFSRYRTYAWNRSVSAPDPSIESQIRAAVDFELPFKRLQRVDMGRSPDLYISTYASVEEEQVINQWGYDVEIPGAASSRSGVLTLPIGALLIDLVDARSGRLVWRGQAAGALASPLSEERLRKAVREIFRHYPWRG